MADSVVSFLLQNLSRLLAHEANLLCGVEDKVRSLHSELEIISVFLKTFEGKNNKNRKGVEQKIVSQIRDIAHVAEDVIDTFITKVAMHKRRSVVRRMLHGFDHAKLLHDVAEKIDKIKTTINEIHDNKIKYDTLESNDHQSAAIEEEERSRLLHQRRSNVEEKDVVGFVHDSEVVIKRLVVGGSRRKVVSVIGMGGLGKTTLTRKVFKSNEVKKHFSCRAWMYLSNECRAKELLLGLLTQLMPITSYEVKRRSIKMGKKHKETEIDMHGNFSSLSLDELKRRVRECLKRKTYLLVLDDLWKNQDWDEVQDAFPDDNRGSRILITSRLKEVAMHTSQDQDPPHYLQFLTEEQSWELFSIKVFREQECPSNLEPLGKEIVKGCRGLPLSIVVLAGLLVNKEKSHREWSKVAAHVNWYVTQDETQVKDIVLKLSYDNLPARLKPCFLYLGIFPEDFEIHVRQLLQRWVAEGFIQETRSRDPDDVAEDYLYELIDRSLIQVAEVKTSGGVKTCRIHDLLRDLCISESKEGKFFEVCMDNNILIPKKPRRLSIHDNMSRYISSCNNDHSCVRSLLCSDPDYYVAPSEWKWLSKCFKLVRVLDLMGECCTRIPSNLGGFIHLRYLRIGSRYIRRVPASICTLWNLQTLDMGPSIMIIPISFPGDIWKLRHLRHLYTFGPIMLRGHPSKLGDEVMWNLQTLSFISLDKQTTSLIEKGMFPKLRKLGLRISSNCDGNMPKVLLSLQQLGHLDKLKISLQTKESEGKKIGFCKPHEMLQNLKHLSHLSVLRIVNAHDFRSCGVLVPPNVTKLTLTGIRFFTDVDMNALGNLTKLRILTLIGGFGLADTFDLNCTSLFPQLQVFRMGDLAIQNWKLTNGAMPHLQSLVINSCRRLVSLPYELWSLSALRKVLVKDPSETVARMLGNLEMKNVSDCELIVC